MGSHCIVLMHVYTILLRNIKARSSQKNNTSSRSDQSVIQVLM